MIILHLNLNQYEKYIQFDQNIHIFVIQGLIFIEAKKELMTVRGGIYRITKTPCSFTRDVIKRKTGSSEEARQNRSK